MIEAIVGNLAGRAGIDLVLVSPLAEISAKSTDQLTLLSIGSSAAVLTWTASEQTMMELDRIGFVGVRSPHAGDPEVRSPSMASSTQATMTQAASTPAAQRKVYAIDLRHVPSVDALIVQLDRLRKVQSIKTFSLGGLTIQSRSADLPQTQSASHSPIKARPIAEVDPSNGQSSPGSGDAGLDALIDQLDEFDAK
jgi:hypothetical protein